MKPESELFYVIGLIAGRKAHLAKEIAQLQSSAPEFHGLSLEAAKEQHYDTIGLLKAQNAFWAMLEAHVQKHGPIKLETQG